MLKEAILSQSDGIELSSLTQKALNFVKDGLSLSKRTYEAKKEESFLINLVLNNCSKTLFNLIISTY
jgi:hypothetical protein